MNDNANALRSKNAKRAMQKRTQERFSSAPKRKRGAKRDAKEASARSAQETYRSAKRSAPKGAKRSAQPRRGEATAI